MLGLDTNEFVLVVFLAVLITAAGWLPRVGDWLGDLVGGSKKGTRERRSEPPRRSKPPARPSDPPPGQNSPPEPPTAG